MIRRLVAEGVGTLLLVATVIGSGIMGENLAAGNSAIALLATAIATSAMLVVLIMVFGPISGAHFNPVVTLVCAFRRTLTAREGAAFIAIQLVTALAGAALAHAMFVVAGYWFTASTSFANPAVTLARAFTESFSGIAPTNVPAFVLAQLAGGALATLLFGWLDGSEARAN